MSEMAFVVNVMNRAKYPTAIQRVNYPIHQGKPNPAHGKYYFVGSVPVACCKENGKSKHYDTEEEAIAAAQAAGAERIQRCDCSFV